MSEEAKELYDKIEGEAKGDKSILMSLCDIVTGGKREVPPRLIHKPTDLIHKPTGLTHKPTGLTHKPTRLTPEE